MHTYCKGKQSVGSCLEPRALDRQSLGYGSYYLAVSDGDHQPIRRLVGTYTCPNLGPNVSDFFHMFQRSTRVTQ